MSGVCPKCVDFFEEESLCPSCGAKLLTPLEWKQQRKARLQGPVPQDVQSVSDSTAVVENKKEFVLGFFLGALLFFLAFLSVILIYGDKFNL